jgi:vitamin B12 transporter
MVKKLWTAGVLGILGMFSWAQENKIDTLNIQQLEEVVVSDTRFPIRRENSGKTVISIGAEELARNQGRSLPEIINTKSGIEISGSRGRAGEVLGVFVRGGRGRQVIVVIDGIRVSDPSSFAQEYDLRLLPLSTIESVEIIKGASSTLYGANAATAVINITTKSASAENMAGSFQSSLGSNQTSSDQRYRINSFENNARISGTHKKWEYVAGFGQRFSDGMSSIATQTDEEDPFSSINTEVKLGYAFSEKLRTTLYASQAKLSTAYDESFGLADASYVFKSTQNRTGLIAFYNYGPGSTTLNLAYATYDSENFSAFPGSFRGQNLIGDLFNKYRFKRVLSILGVNYNLERTDFEGYRQFNFIDPYLSLVYLGGKGFQLNIGGRLNLHSEYGSNFVYSFNPSYTISTQEGYIKLLGSYATAYITPSLTQLFGQFGANPDLLPEDNRTFELGAEYAANNSFRANAVYFARREMDFVFFDNVNFRYENSAGTINASGVELEFDWKPVGDLSFQANYTFTERKGDSAIRIPKHKINTVLGYQFTDPFFVSVNFSYTGTRSDTDFNTFTDVALDPFGLLGMNLRYSVLPDRLTVFLSGDNLLNKKYEEIIGFNTRGRNIRGGFNLKL